MSSMLAADARLAAVAVTQHGAFTRAQAAAAGFGAAQIERRVRNGVWSRLLPRVYRHGSTPESNVLSHWAAVLWAGPGCALSHVSAAAIWRIRDASVAAPELTVPRHRAPRVGGVVVHRVSSIGGNDVVSVRGLPITSPVRTIIDLAGSLAEPELEAAFERARSRGLVTVRAVGVRLDEMGTVGRPGTARLRTLLAAVGSGRVDASARMAG
jgi:hypothetical protein